MIRRLPAASLVESAMPRPLAAAQVHLPVLPDVVSHIDEADARTYREAYAEGFQAGEEDGRREAEQYQRAWEEETRKQLEEEHRAMVQEREKLAALLASLNEQLRSYHEGMEQLAFEIALHCLAAGFGSREGDVDWMHRLCSQMAKGYRGRNLRLEVSEADCHTLPERIEGVEIAVEHSLSAGECRLVTDRGFAETSLKVRLEAIYGAMLETLAAMERA